MIRIERLADATMAAPLLHELRHVLDNATLARRLAAAQAQGYRVIAASDGETMVGALGCRVIDDLCWGRSLFVDDLVVTETRRGAGIGASLLQAARDLAADEDCAHLRLCSGLARTDAHRFYETQGMTGRSLHFVQSLEQG